MPHSQFINMEWLAHNSVRHYPLAADATLTDVTGGFVLPEDFLVALYMSIPEALNVSDYNFLLQNVQAFATGFAVTIGYWTGSEIVPVAAGAVLRATHTQYRSYPLRGLGDFYDVSGHMTIGRFDNIDLQPPGSWNFDINGGRLETDVYHPQIRGVTQFQVQNGSDLSIPITGDIILRAGKNIRITPVLVSGEDPVIVIDAISGEGLNDECVCDGQNDPGKPIKTINGVSPTPAGDFTFTGTSCLKITPGTNGLTFEDTCAKPCCGCTELETVIDEVKTRRQEEANLRTLINALNIRVTQFDQVVGGAQLNDQGCP